MCILNSKFLPGVISRTLVERGGEGRRRQGMESDGLEGRRNEGEWGGYILGEENGGEERGEKRKEGRKMEVVLKERGKVASWLLEE